MKRLRFISDLKKRTPDLDSILLVGKIDEVKGTFKRMAQRSSTLDLQPLYGNAKFSNEKQVYGIYIDYANQWFQIVNSDTIMSYIVDDLLVEEF